MYGIILRGTCTLTSGKCISCRLTRIGLKYIIKTKILPTQSPCEELGSSSPLQHASQSLIFYIFKWLSVLAFFITYLIYTMLLHINDFIWPKKSFCQFSALDLLTGEVCEQYQLVTLKLASFAVPFVIRFFCFNCTTIMLPLASSNLRACSVNAAG